MRLLIAVGVALSLTLASCASHSTLNLAPRDMAPYGLKLTALADPALNQSAPRLELSLDRGIKELSVTISGSGLVNVRSVYFELAYDAVQLNPIAVTQSGLADKGEVLSLNLLDCPGQIRSGQVLLHPQTHTGLSGDADLAVVRFTYAPYQAQPGARIASAPPGTNASKALLDWDGPTAFLSWGYTVSGDYNQDGAVSVADLTPLGMHYGELGPFMAKSVQCVIDGTGDQALNAADLSPIGINYGKNASSGYAVFETTDLANYPASNTDPPAIAALFTLPLTIASGQPNLDQLQFTYQVPAPVPQAYYFVRPVDNLGACGTPSYTAGGNATVLPVLGVTNPPGIGNGSSAAPYWINSSETYTLQLLVPGLGDVSLDPQTQYFLSDDAAGDLVAASPTFTADPEWVGDFTINASFHNTQAVAPVHFYVQPPYSTMHTWIDVGNPAANVTGQYCSMASIAGEPAVAYYEETTGTLHYAFYISATSTWVPSLVDNAGIVGKYCSMLALDNGCPAIVYFDQDNQCIKIACAKKTLPSGVGDWVTYAASYDIYPTEFDTHLVNGTMAVVFNKVSTDELYYMRTYEAFPDDITDWVWHSVTGVGDQAMPSLEWVDGVPAIAYYDASAMDLRYCYGKLPEPGSTDDWVKMAIDSNDAVGLNPQLYAMDGWLPVIAYFDWTHGDLKFAQAKKSKPLSASDWTLTYIDRQADMVGTVISMDAVDGRLCIAYKDYTNDWMWFARNKTPYPKGPQSWQVWNISNSGQVGDYICLRELYGPANAIPGITYFNKTSGNLGFIVAQ